MPLQHATGIAYTDAGSGPVLVLVHAFPLCRDMWAPQLAGLSAGYRLLLPDVAGFGESSLPDGGWTVDSMADRLADWLTGLGVTEPVLFGGLSMGGYIALAFARRHPGRVRGLILADTRADADTAEAKANRDKTITMVEEKGVSALVEQMMPKLLSETTRTTKPEVVEVVRSMGSSQTTASVTAALRALRDRPDSTSSLATFTFPTLVVVGANDVTTPVALSEAMAGQLRHATLVVVPQAGHLSNLESPDAFNTAIRVWCGERPA